jgi:hypothetical protein
MNRSTVRIPRRAATSVLLLSLAGCTATPPASLLLTITGSPGAPAPEAVQVRTFDGHGPLQAFTSFAAPPPGADGRLGTVVIYTPRGEGGALRVQAQGLRRGAVVSEGTARAMVAAGKQAAATLTLTATRPADGDADGVPDEIDNCVALTNARQEDANQDGKGDACSSGPPGPSITTVADAAPAADAGCACEAKPDPRPLGAACSTGADCRSSFCTDGVCCETGDCGGACRACNLPGAAGACRDIPLEGAPRAGGCPSEPVSSCGRTGKCDGAGSCQRHPVGATCRPGRCTDGTEEAPSTCSAYGTCMPGRSITCSGGFACKGDLCATSCATERECAEEFYCVSGACQPRHASGTPCKDGPECRTGFCADGHCCAVPRCADGAWCGGPGGSCLNKRFLGDPGACTAGYECNSGFCVDGVCCESACTDSCRTCADPAMIGRCVPANAGIDSNADTPCLAPKRCQAGSCR